jgi:hypothetical protein
MARIITERTDARNFSLAEVRTEEIHHSPPTVEFEPSLKTSIGHFTRATVRGAATGWQPTAQVLTKRDDRRDYPIFGAEAPKALYHPGTLLQCRPRAP